jgi:galactokinase
VRISDHRWGGYLANVTPSEWLHDFESRIPEAITGAEFLQRYAGTADPVTSVDPKVTYPVRHPTRHPIEEHLRVRTFAELLQHPPSESRLGLLGELMYQSHASYSACGLGSEATDTLVEMVRGLGPDSGLYGAKITGAGSGGTVAILGRADARAALVDIAERYARLSGRRPAVFSGSGPGAHQFGIERWRSGFQLPGDEVK